MFTLVPRGTGISSGRGFITNHVFLVTKYDGNYNWYDFHTISANVVTWKDEEYVYISSA